MKTRRSYDCPDDKAIRSADGLVTGRRVDRRVALQRYCSLQCRPSA